jgi:hypothetical protein
MSVNQDDFSFDGALVDSLGRAVAAITERFLQRRRRADQFLF